MLFRSAVECSGGEVVEAVNGDDCLVQAWISRPDIVILDVVMPGRDGLSTLQDLRELCPDAVVILASALASSELVEQGRARGATDCIDKLQLLPLLPTLLAETAVTV